VSEPKNRDVVDNSKRDTPVRGSIYDPDTGKRVQWYDDGYRHTTSPDHWTDQNAPKGDPGRHDPPADRQE